MELGFIFSDSLALKYPVKLMVFRLLNKRFRLPISREVTKRVILTSSLNPDESAAWWRRFSIYS